VYLVGLTGGIGSGKTTVARLLAARGAHVIDADRLAREVVEPGTPGNAEILDRFGADIADDLGRIDRTALAAIVFADPDALRDLNAIVHPRVGERIASELTDLAATDELAVLDVPLLTEAGVSRGYDAVVVVTAPEHVRVERLVERGLTAEDARARIANQASDAERLALATHVVENSGTLAALDAAVDDLYDELVAAASRP